MKDNAIDTIQHSDKDDTHWVIGIDEVGRGPIAGPVCVCVAAMKKEYYDMWCVDAVVQKSLRDSKKMTEKARNTWYEQSLVLEKKDVARAVCIMRSAQDIDTQGIVPCITSCINEACAMLADRGVSARHSYVFLDGGLHAPAEYTQETVIRGDGIHKIISLASVVAKVTRDTLMKELSEQYPQYQWQNNKGYGTKAHYEAIAQHSVTPLHRKTFL